MGVARGLDLTLGRPDSENGGCKGATPKDTPDHIIPADDLGCDGSACHEEEDGAHQEEVVDSPVEHLIAEGDAGEVDGHCHGQSDHEEITPHCVQDSTPPAQHMRPHPLSRVNQPSGPLPSASSLPEGLCAVVARKACHHVFCCWALDWFLFGESWAGMSGDFRAMSMLLGEPLDLQSATLSADGGGRVVVVMLGQVPMGAKTIKFKICSLSECTQKLTIF